MIAVEISKEDYADPKVQQWLATKQRGVEFSLSISLIGFHASGPISREQLQLFHQEIGKLLKSKKKAVYTVENKSSMCVEIIADED